MSTDIACIEPSTYLVLQEGGEMVEALQANLAGGAIDETMLTRVKFPSQGDTVWRIPGLTKDERTESITGALVGSFARGVLWPSLEVIGDGARPVLVARDTGAGLTTAALVGDPPPAMRENLDAFKLADGSYDWQKLAGGKYPDSPYGWGSGKNGIGKWAKEQRVLFVLRADEAMPLMISVGAGSIESYKEWIKTLLQKGVPWFRCVVTLGLKPEKSSGGIEYSKLTMATAGILDRDTAQQFRRLYHENLSKLFQTMEVESDE